LFVAETVYLNESRGLSFFLPVPASVELTSLRNSEYWRGNSIAQVCLTSMHLISFAPSGGFSLAIVLSTGSAYTNTRLQSRNNRSVVRLWSHSSITGFCGIGIIPTSVKLAKNQQASKTDRFDSRPLTYFFIEPGRFRTHTLAFLLAWVIGFVRSLTSRSITSALHDKSAELSLVCDLCLLWSPLPRSNLHLDRT